jgi:hypothetical protein
MRKSTNKLTKHELDFASSIEYPLIKHEVMSKMGSLMAETGQQLSHTFRENQLIDLAHHKITRGERYKQMPYIVLDYPQIKGPDFNIVLRTMFWWGHYFTCSLIVKTSLLDLEKTGKSIRKLKKTKILVGSNLWEQELEMDDYRKTSDLNKKQMTKLLEAANYLKLSRKISLRHYTSLTEHATEIYSELAKALSIKKELSD